MNARRGREPGPNGFVWRGIRFAAPVGPELGQFYSGPTIEIGELRDELRAADWKVRRTLSAWHARLRIGADRYPGVGATAVEALEMALAEAANVATYIVAMLPPGGGLREIGDLAARRRAVSRSTPARKPQRASKVRR